MEHLHHHSETDQEDTALLRAVPDLRGLPAEDASGIGVGELWGALAEAETGLIRYLDLQLSTLDRHVLVPIGHARVRTEEQKGTRIRLRGALLEELEQIPPFPAELGHIDDPFERALLEAYGRTFHGERYYAHPSYDHSGLFAGDHLVLNGVVEEAEGPLRRMAYLAGWRVAEDSTDVRGSNLRLDGDGSTAAIEDYIVDTGAGMVRYLVLQPDAGPPRLLPVGYVALTGDNGASAAGLTMEDITELPAYDGGGVSREQEERVHAVLRRRLSGTRRYLLPDFRPAL